MKYAEPNRNDIELIVFGPGYGESILLHYAGKWIIVDSCINPETKKPAAIEYIEKINVNTDAVSHIIITHWHDDHIRGLAETISTCKKAAVFMPNSLNTDAFIGLIKGFYNVVKTDLKNGPDEILESILSIKNSNRTPSFVGANYSILLSPDIDIHAISPSNIEFMKAVSSFAKLSSTLSGEIRRLPTVQPNDTAVALFIRIHNEYFLLGSDLEFSPTNKSVGWSAASSCQCFSTGQKAFFYKIAHHGSKNADPDLIWEKLLNNEPHAVVTPFINGGITLPDTLDKKRISSRTKNAYITGPTLKKKTIPLDRAVEKQMSTLSRNRRPISLSFGFVKLCCVFNDGNMNIRVEKTSSASLLS